MTTEREIASDLLDYLRETPGVCARGNVHGWAWIRHHDGEWQATKYSTSDEHRLKGRVVGEVLDEDEVMDWLVAKPVEIVPQSEAYLWRPKEETVWTDADEQDVFAEYDRCFWCGCSERANDLTLYETVENGDCHLCDDCHESWVRADEIVAEVSEERSPTAD